MNTALYLCQHFGSDGHGCKGLRKVQQMLKDSCKITPFDIAGIVVKALRLFYMIIANVMYSIVVLYHYYCRNSATSVAFIFIQSLFSLLILNGIPYTSILCSDIYVILYMMIISDECSVHCVLDISDDHRLSIACLLQDPGEVVTKLGEKSFIPAHTHTSTYMYIYVMYVFVWVKLQVLYLAKTVSQVATLRVLNVPPYRYQAGANGSTGNRAAPRKENMKAKSKTPSPTWKHLSICFTNPIWSKNRYTIDELSMGHTRKCNDGKNI